MGTVRSDQELKTDSARILEKTLRGYDVARAGAAAAADGLSSSSAQFLQDVRAKEEELDVLDREINEAVTVAIVNCAAAQARELLACLKAIYELERIGDLLLSFANRARSVYARLDSEDVKDLSTMTALLEKMLCPGVGSLPEAQHRSCLVGPARRYRNGPAQKPPVCTPHREPGTGPAPRKAFRSCL